MARPPFERRNESTNVFQRAVINGHAYRVSSRRTLAQGEEFIVHIDPADAGGTVYVEAPAIGTEVRAEIDVYENANPDTSLQDDLEVHNMRYDANTLEGASEQPEALVQRVADQGLDISGADKTEETQVDADNPDIETGGAAVRGIWRIIPTTDIISIVMTDRSTGSGNNFSFDFTLYEGETLPN